MARITAARPITPGSSAATSSPIASVSTPTATSATTVPPSSVAGTTARTERPSVPFVVSVTVRPWAAGAKVPTKGLPIRSAFGCE